MSSPSCFSSEFYRLEPVDIFTIEEHEPDSADSLVDLERMAREKSSLDDNSVWIIVEERPGGQKGERALTLFLTINKKRR